MKTACVRGIIVPIITPMKADESLDIERLHNHINRMIDAGVDGIFCLGTNGEAFALSHAEKETVISETIACVKGRVPVHVGTGCVTTAETIRLSRYAQAAGADVLSVITPYFSAVTQQQLIAHYKDLLSSVDIPVMVYNMPARTGVNVSPDTWGTLSRLNGICGIKDSSGNFTNMLAYIRQSAESGCAVLSGNDGLILWNLLAGGHGAISGCANVYPKVVTGIYRAFLQQDFSQAHLLQNSLSSFRDLFRYGNSNTVIKLAQGELGQLVGTCRKPFDAISEEGMAALRTVLKENAALCMA